MKRVQFAYRNMNNSYGFRIKSDMCKWSIDTFSTCHNGLNGDNAVFRPMSNNVYV